MILDNPDAIMRYKLLTLRQMLKLEITGMKRHGRSAYSIIKQELGLKGSRTAVLQELSTILGKD